jgi:hypothetical protein
MSVFNEWKRDHRSDIPILFATLEKDIATVNIRTKQITVDLAAMHATASRLEINIDLFTYYVLSHEWGHVSYQHSDKLVEEEYYAHDYAIQDCKKNLGPAILSDIDKLDAIKSKIVI